MKLKTLLKISRPKFWLYLAGPFLVGFTAGSSHLADFASINFWILLLFFLVPANIFLYGINDLFDIPTDKYNKKKKSSEHLLQKSETKSLKTVLLLCLVMTVVVVWILPNLTSQLWLLGFIFLATFYSSPPLRFKSSPLLDFSSNLLYAIPGFVGFSTLTNSSISKEVILAAFCWTGAMHLFSAIPDITADKKAGITTSAVFLGEKKSLLLCTVLWFSCALTVQLIFGLTLTTLIAFIYPLIALLVFFKKNPDLPKIYRYYPYINTLFGFILFLAVAFK